MKEEEKHRCPEKDDAIINILDLMLKIHKWKIFSVFGLVFILIMVTIWSVVLISLTKSRVRLDKVTKLCTNTHPDEIQTVLRCVGVKKNKVGT